MGSLQFFSSIKNSCVYCTSLLGWALPCSWFLTGLFFCDSAGAQSSDQCETAGVYELQGQVVRDAPQEVSSGSNSNYIFPVWLVCVSSDHCRLSISAALLAFVRLYCTDAICLITPPYCFGPPLHLWENCLLLALLRFKPCSKNYKIKNKPTHRMKT